MGNIAEWKAASISALTADPHQKIFWVHFLHKDANSSSTALNYCVGLHWQGCVNHMLHQWLKMQIYIKGKENEKNHFVIMKKVENELSAWKSDDQQMKNWFRCFTVF